MSAPRSPSIGYVRALVEDDPAELYEDAPCGYLSTDSDGHITKVNRTFCTWTGFTAQELVGSLFQSSLTVGDRVFFETHFAPSLALQGTVREVAVEVMCASGDRLPVLLNAVRADRPGHEPRIRIAVFDARERRSYERELLAERRRAEEAAEDARQLAETLQRTLLPASTPQIEGMRLGAAYRPAGDGRVVGGDFYDIFEIHDGTWGISLGDVCGKGAPAAVVTALARHTIRALAVRAAAPSDVLRGLHEAIMRSPETDGFCTAVFLTARVTDHGVQLRLSVGGHHLPLHLGPSGVCEVGRTGHLLGMLDPIRLHDDAVLLRPGESLVLYTDGVLEAHNGSEFFGEHRLHDLLDHRRDVPARELADEVAAAAVDYQHANTRDDIAVVVLQAAHADD